MCCEGGFGAVCDLLRTAHMSETTALLVVVVVTALGFDFTNGLHDTANAMATTIATGPR